MFTATDAVVRPQRRHLLLAGASTSLAAAVGVAVALVRVGRHVDIDWLVVRAVSREFRANCWGMKNERGPLLYLESRHMRVSTQSKGVNDTTESS
ncbi:hypothetical protein BKA82DRAFT_994562 [Pisolithus tinctorius]|uniref:Uncharacterized protein n=1 Tax=Pisolithus tinctorius Marx 270 TaxID=870435 RepID=A0A0C3PS04_PISTI|nr:hypothetical protein BKA82DRAFT_994562 [Pisolithus tinctorius]KIO11876.1 hypothetical protein M404DRAFT_994562 [Pisolithus tinctorius Marx 270]